MSLIQAVLVLVAAASLGYTAERTYAILHGTDGMTLYLAGLGQGVAATVLILCMRTLMAPVAWNETTTSRKPAAASPAAPSPRNLIKGVAAAAPTIYSLDEYENKKAARRAAASPARKHTPKKAATKSPKSASKSPSKSPPRSALRSGRTPKKAAKYSPSGQ